jgi:hypothetical protein
MCSVLGVFECVACLVCTTETVAALLRAERGVGNVQCCCEGDGSGW